MAPAKLPPAVAQRLEQAATQVLQQADAQKRFASLTIEPDFKPAAAFRGEVELESRKRADVIASIQNRN